MAFCAAVVLWYVLRQSPWSLLQVVKAITTAALAPLILYAAYAMLRPRARRMRRLLYVLGKKTNSISISRTILVAEVVIVTLLLAVLLTGNRAAFVDGLGSRADLSIAVIAMALIVVLDQTVNRKLAGLLERRLSRAVYDEGQILSDLGQAARASDVRSLDELFELVVSRIQSALRVDAVSIFVRDDSSGDYQCATTSVWAGGGEAENRGERGEEAAPMLVLGRNAFVVRRLARLTAPLTVEPRDFETWLLALEAGQNLAEKASRQREIETLRRINSRMLLQIRLKDQMVGIMSLGARPSNRPFTARDKQMLMSVAGQMSFIIENTKLVQRIAKEERLKHELELATEVQRRLFPECPPEIESLELTGFCQPAGGVGGDYYDFIALGPDRVGIAVADVAGKGISAALLMSIVQASLRSQAPFVRGSLPELVATMNELMHRSSGPSSYATFFYGQYDQRQRSLSYVNAGHNPPILVRARRSEPSPVTTAGRRAASLAGCSAEVAAPMIAPHQTETEPTISRLSTGGSVIGLFSNCSYAEETIQLESGDVLCAYTDGVTEALDEAGEEFGEERLQNVLLSARGLSADEVSARIVESVRAWCGAAPQHDDLTFVIMKMK